jgi:group I intron endonuclease
MTTGIYALYFENTDKVYIGQSSNIERRINTHKKELNKGVHINNKLQEAYCLYGEPLCIILEVCTIDVLTVRETYWINDFDSVENGYNIVYPSWNGSGPYYSNSKYDILTVIKVFRYSYLDLYKNLTYNEIALKLNVSAALVNSIRSQKSHLWLKQRYPYQYNKMVALLGTRNGKLTHKKYLIKSPTLELFEISNISQFAKQNSLDRRHLHKVIQGKAKSHKGWVLA